MINQWIKAGELEVLIDQGFVRYVKIGEMEILRGIYAAVRDQNWDTIPAQLNVTKQVINQNSFDIAFHAVYMQNRIHFKANYTITGTSNAEIIVCMNGVACDTFMKNRIGFCVLHPIKECSGFGCEIVHTNGEVTHAQFPELISPYQPFVDIKTMKWGTEHGFEAQLNFEGDIFETEDQRNWTDTSFKTYCTPLLEPFPKFMKKGDLVSQKVVLKVTVNEIKLNKTRSITPIISNIDVERINATPIGLGISTQDNLLNDFQAARLLKLKINHLKADIYPFQPSWQQDLNRAILQTQQIETKLKCVLHFGENIVNESNSFLNYIERENLPFDSILLLQFNKTGLEKGIQNQLISLFKKKLPFIPIGIGTDANFAELNRAKIDMTMPDFISFTINPQVHTFDNLTIIENIEAQADVVKSAKVLSKNKPVHIHAITLKRRFNSVAQNPNVIEPAETDIRQPTRFCADWTKESIKTLILAGANSITYYETTGERGIMNIDMVFPVYYSFYSG